MALIQVLGMGCPKCNMLYENAEKAAKELGIQYHIEKVNDIDKITEMGVMSTPALVIDGAVKASGKVPSTEQIKEMLPK